MKIVLLDVDTYGADIDLTPLSALGEIVIYQQSASQEVASRIVDADIVVANKALLNEEALAKAQQLGLICIAATGTNNVDLPYCRQRQIAVTNVAGYSTESVVQHTFAMLLYLLEKLAYYDACVQQRIYEKSPVFTHFGPAFSELSGKIWGIVGMGEIGQGVARVATAFGCRIVYSDLMPITGDWEFCTFQDVLAQSDVVSLHLPLTEDTKNLMDMDALRQMKSSAILLNLARGGIVNEADLALALQEGTIAGAGLDVLDKEPMTSDNPLHCAFAKGRLLITPHMAWASVEARDRLIREVAWNILSWKKGRKRNRVE